jgi:hypothetical protein
MGVQSMGNWSPVCRELEPSSCIYLTKMPIFVATNDLIEIEKYVYISASSQNDSTVCWQLK